MLKVSAATSGIPAQSNMLGGQRGFGPKANGHTPQVNLSGSKA